MARVAGTRGVGTRGARRWGSGAGGTTGPATRRGAMISRILGATVRAADRERRAVDRERREPLPSRGTAEWTAKVEAIELDGPPRWLPADASLQERTARRPTRMKRNVARRFTLDRTSLGAGSVPWLGGELTPAASGSSVVSRPERPPRHAVGPERFRYLTHAWDVGTTRLALQGSVNLRGVSNEGRRGGPAHLSQNAASWSRRGPAMLDSWDRGSRPTASGSPERRAKKR